MKEQQFYIDIGGGTNPDFFFTRSQIDPHSQYIVLDPTIRALPNKPSNLHLIKWQCDDISDLPFRQGTISGIYMSNIFDELRTDGDQLDWSDTESVFENGYYNSKDIQDSNRQRGLYSRILHSSKKLLKSDGMLNITEPSENIPAILELCINEGFYVVLRPQLVTDSTRTLWTNWFHDIYDVLEAHEGKNDVAPTEFTIKLAA